MLDLGCGRGELSLRIIERFGSTVVAIDHSSYMLDAARERAQWTGALGRLHLDDTDIRDFDADPETFHLAVMLDAGGIAGGMPGICLKLRGWTRSGGYVLVGINYWKRKPHAEIFEQVLDDNRLKPDETLFLDDNHDNVVGASKVGIRTAYVNTPDYILTYFDDARN